MGRQLRFFIRQLSHRQPPYLPLPSSRAAVRAGLHSSMVKVVCQRVVNRSRLILGGSARPLLHLRHLVQATPTQGACDANCRYTVATTAMSYSVCERALLLDHAPRNHSRGRSLRVTNRAHWTSRQCHSRAKHTALTVTTTPWVRIILLTPSRRMEKIQSYDIYNIYQKVPQTFGMMEPPTRRCITFHYSCDPQTQVYVTPTKSVV